MLDRQYLNDLYYLQAHHQERIQAASVPRVHAQHSSVKVKDRIYLALGERLIALGQRLKDEVVYNEFLEECCA
jgi:hypothetical protein